MGIVYSKFFSGAGSSDGISSYTAASFHDEGHHPTNVELKDNHGNEISLGKPVRNVSACFVVRSVFITRIEFTHLCSFTYVHARAFAHTHAVISHSLTHSPTHSLTPNPHDLNLALQTQTKPNSIKIVQKYEAPKELMGRFNVIGSWVIGGMPAGIGIREDLAEITNDDSCFVPHIIVDKTGSAASPTAPASTLCAAPRVAPGAKQSTVYGDADLTKLNSKVQQNLRHRLYGNNEKFEKSARYWCSHQGTLATLGDESKGDESHRTSESRSGYRGILRRALWDAEDRASRYSGSGSDASTDSTKRQAAPKKGAGAAAAAADYKPSNHTFDRHRAKGGAGKGGSGARSRRTGGMRWGGGG